MNPLDLRRGMSVTHPVYGRGIALHDGERTPLGRPAADTKVLFDRDVATRCPRRVCVAHLAAEPAAPVIVNGDSFPLSGAVHDAVVGGIEDRLAERDVVPMTSAASIVYPRSFGGSNIVELSPRRRPDGGM